MFLKQMFAELDEKMPCLRRQDGKTILYYFLHVVPLSYPCCTPGCGLGCTFVVPLVVALVVFDTTGCRHVVVSPWKKASLFVPCCTLFCPLVVLYHWLSPWLYPWSNVPLVVLYQ